MRAEHAVAPSLTADGGFVPFGAAAVLTAVLSCLNSGLYVVSRVLFVFARHGDAPAGLMAVDRRQVPTRSIAVGLLVALAYLAIKRRGGGTAGAVLADEAVA